MKSKISVFSAFILCTSVLPSDAAASSDGLVLHSSWLDSTSPDQKASLGGIPEVGQNSSTKSVGNSGRNSVSPDGRQLGFGFQIGGPTAINMKFMVTGNQGVVAGIGAGLGGLSLHVDYLWHPSVIVGTDALTLSWYVGVGGWLGFFPTLPGFSPLGPFGPRSGVGYYNGHFGYVYLPDDYLWYAPSFAIRVPLGLSLAFNSLPIEVYGGLTPSLLIFPGLGFGMGGELGARVYF